MSLISKSTSLSATLLLLVAYLLYCDNAQARILVPNTVVTSSLNTTAGTEAEAMLAAASSEASTILGDATKKSKLETAKQNPVNLEPATAVVVRQSSSVVQDWSLVCKELCGAGFGVGGVLSCAAVCSTTKTVATDDQPSALSRIASDEVLSRNANKLLICKDLCRLHLGNEACNCGQSAIELTPNERDEVCQTFCVNGKVTLNGCSPCKLVENGMKFYLGTSKKLKGALRTAVTNSNTSSTSTTTTNKKTSTQNATHGSWANEMNKDIEDNTSNKDDIVNIDIEQRSNNGTTPDWNELCKSLCKTGDGGSLCKCDLSPFFY